MSLQYKSIAQQPQPNPVSFSGDYQNIKIRVETKGELGSRLDVSLVWGSYLEPGNLSVNYPSISLNMCEMLLERTVRLSHK